MKTIIFPMKKINYTSDGAPSKTKPSDGGFAGLQGLHASVQGIAYGPMENPTS